MAASVGGHGEYTDGLKQTEFPRFVHGQALVEWGVEDYTASRKNNLERSITFTP